MLDKYHYTESGLDNVWLHGGVELVDHPSGMQVRIRDIEGLHKVIGKVLTEKKGSLNGKELRFLRQEMLLSQANLAKLLQVTEQTVHRWETAKADIPKPAESLIRFMYMQQFEQGKDFDVRGTLQRLADLEDEMDGLEFAMSKNKQQWLQQKQAA